MSNPRGAGATCGPAAAAAPSDAGLAPEMPTSESEVATAGEAAAGISALGGVTSALGASGEAASTGVADARAALGDCYQRLETAVRQYDGTPAQKAVLRKLQGEQVKHMKLEEDYRREWNKLKLKYLDLFQPLYAARKEALTTLAAADQIECSEHSDAKPTEMSGALDGSAKLEADASVAAALKTGTQALPQFWLQAMRNHILLSEMIEAHDVPILAYLQDVVFQWVDPADQTGFKLEFIFAPNEHFENTILTKTYHLERLEDDEESVLTKTEGTIIRWKEGRNVTQKSVIKKQRNRRTQETRTVVQVVDEHSFFNYFQSHEIPSEQQLEEMNEREVSELEMIVEAEFEVGCILRDRIIPRALGWYLGIEHDEDAENDDLSDEGAEDYEDADEDGDDDNEEDEEDDDISGYEEDEEEDEIQRGAAKRRFPKRDAKPKRSTKSGV